MSRCARSTNPAKPRASHSQLRTLSHAARSRLHEWFRHDGGTTPLHEIQAKIKAEFGFSVGISTLSNYYSDNFREITNPFGAEATAEATTIMIRIDVPPGCKINVSTEPTEGAA